jgi:hypothetical protein
MQLGFLGDIGDGAVTTRMLLLPRMPRQIALVLIVLGILLGSLNARVMRVEIASRSDVLNGKEFGNGRLARPGHSQQGRAQDIFL